jgi:hypothetical protein
MAACTTPKYSRSFSSNGRCLGPKKAPSSAESQSTTREHENETREVDYCVHRLVVPDNDCQSDFLRLKVIPAMVIT